MGPNIFGRIYAPLTIFIDESPKMEATSAVTTLASKLHSNITLAFINWYCLVPDLKYDGSRVTNWQDAFNSSRISTYDQSFTVYLYDIMGAAAVSVVNHRTDIFPNTTVNVERFSDCGQYWPTVEQDFIGHTIGYSAAETAQDIVFKNTDVIGVFGNQYSSYAKVTGEIFSDYDIPYCTAISGAPTLADKKLYPFLFRLMEGSIDKIVNLALQSWNVTRMAIIYEYDDLLSSATAFKIQQAMKSSGIDVVSMVKLSSFVDQNMIDYAAIELTVSQARYIYLSGQSDFSSKVFFSLAIEGLVGPDYVWFGQNTPGYIGTDISKLPKLDKINSRDPWNVKRLSSWLEGFLYTSPSQSSVDTPLAHEFYKQFLELSQFSPDNITYLGLQLENLWGVFSMFDCVLMMLTGFDEFLKNNPQYSPQQLSSRELSSNFNFSYFRSIQYNGLISSPLHLDENGDIEQANVIKAYLGSNPDYNNTGFRTNVLLETDAQITKLSTFNHTSLLFNGGGSIPPPDGPRKAVVVNYVSTLSTANGKVILAFAILGIIINCFFGAFIFWFRNEKVVKIASVPECLVIVVGCLFCNISIFLYLNDVTTTHCHVRIWTVLIGYIFTIAPLLMKNARLAFIFKSKTKVDTKRLTFIIRSLIGLCLAIEVSLLLAWTLKATTKPVQITANSISFAACASKDLPGSPTIKLLQAYNISLLLCLPILAYVLKDVDPILNESPAILTTGAIVGIMAAVLAILPSNPSYNLDMASSLCIWAATTLTQCTLFASKVNEVLFQELIEKGLLKRSLKSSFEAGASRHTQTMGVKPPLRAMAPSVVGGGVVRVSALSTRNVSANELDAKAKLNPEEHEQGVSSNTDQQYTSVSGISQRDSSALDRIKKEEPPGMRIQKTSKTSFRGMPAKVSTTTPGLERDATIKGDPGYRRHPVECLAIKGLQVFKLKKGWVPLWQVWTHGVCYLYQVRKTAWFSFNTLKDIPSFVLTASTTAIGHGVNSVIVRDSSKHEFCFVLEFGNKEEAGAFVSEFGKVRDDMLRIMKGTKN